MNNDLVMSLAPIIAQPISTLTSGNFNQMLPTPNCPTNCQIIEEQGNIVSVVCGVAWGC